MSGGAGMYRGANFQSEVATFFAVLALAEDTSALPDELVRFAPPTRVGAEQNWPVDDTAVWFGRDSARAFVQAKFSLTSSDAADSEFAEVIEQFVKQWIYGRDRVAGVPLLPSDRLMLVLGPNSSRPLTDDLRRLLHRISLLAADEQLSDATAGEASTLDALIRVSGHVRRILRAENRNDDEETVRAVLSHARIWPTTSEALLQQCRLLLRAFIVVDPGTVDAALTVLLREFAVAAQRRTAHNVEQLRGALRVAGIVLREPPSIAPDVAILEDVTERTIRGEARLLRTREGDVRISRSVVAEVVLALRHGHLIVTAEAGAGKSDVLIEAANAMRVSGDRVVFLDATDPLMADPRRAMGLAHDLDDALLRSGDPNRTAYLFIDGFDSTRLGPSFDSLIRLVRHLRVSGRAWHVAVASREYDLVHAGVIAELFPFDPTQPVAPERRDETRFGRHAHLFIPRLSNAELDSVGAASPALRSIVVGASAELLDLLRNPFNLSVAASFTLGAGDVPDLSQVRNQIQLLDLWWSRRVLPGDQSRAKERILRAVTQAMVTGRSLRVSPDLLPDGPAAEELLSSTVLELAGARGRELRFRHAIVFDYAVDRILLATAGATANLLGQDRDAFLFVLPSIRMRFDELWSLDRASFYHELALLFAEDTQRRTLLMIVARIPFEKFTSVNDLIPLLDSDDPKSVAAIRFIVRTLIYEREHGEVVAGETSRPWAEVALEMARRLPRHEHDTLLLLQELKNLSVMTQPKRSQRAEAARLAIAWQLDRTEYAPVFMQMAIAAFALSYDQDATSARPLLDRIIAPTRVALFGQYELEPLARAASAIRDPDALEAIYAAVFSDVEVDPGNVSIGARSTLMSFVQSGRQSVEMARRNLAQRFASLLDEDPRVGVRVLVRVIDREARRRRFGEDRHLEFSIGERTVRVIRDGSSVWDGSLHSHEDWFTMAAAFESRLKEQLAAGNTNLFATAIAVLSENVRAAYLWRVIVRVASLDPVSAHDAVPLVTNARALVSSEFGRPISLFLAGFGKLSGADRRAVVDALSALPEAPGVEDEYRQHLIALRAEYARSIPTDARDDERLRDLLDVEQAPGGEDADADDERRQALLFDGAYIGGATTSEMPLEEEALEAGASSELAAALAAMQPRFRQNVPVPSDAKAYMDGVREIDRLSRDEADSVRQAALDVIAALVRKGLEEEAFSLAERAELLPLVFEAAHGAHPSERDPREAAEREEQFGSHPSWGSASARIDAVQCLWRIYRYEQREDVLDEIERLATDADPAVRFLAIEGAWSTRTAAPDVGWLLAEAGVADPNRSVWAAALWVANALPDTNAIRRDGMMLAVYDRLEAEGRRSDLRLDLLRWLLDRGLYETDARAMERLRPVLEEPWTRRDLAMELAFELGNRMTPGLSIDRRRLVAASLERFIESLLAKAAELSSRCGFNVDSYPAPEAAEMHTVIELLTEISQRLYFASSVMQQPIRNGPFEDTGVIDAESFALLRPLLASIASFPFSATAYHVLKVLFGAIEMAPRDVLLLGGAAILNGVKGGLLNEMMAEDDVRSFVSTYIESHRGLLEGDRACLAIVMDIVDAYVDAGWPKWIEVIAELDSIYRSD